MSQFLYSSCLHTSTMSHKNNFATFLKICFLKNWNMVDLQCCVSFRYTTKWINFMCIYINFFRLFPLQVITIYWVQFLLVIYFIYNSWESLGLQGDPTSPFWRRSALGFLWKEWCWSWNSSTLVTSCEELTHWKRLWCWKGLGAGGEGDNRRWDGWMASLTRWTWVSVNSGSWWWTGRPGVLRFMGLQRVGHDWVTDLIWSEYVHVNPKLLIYPSLSPLATRNLFSMSVSLFLFLYISSYVSSFF